MRVLAAGRAGEDVAAAETYVDNQARILNLAGPGEIKFVRCAVRFVVMIHESFTLYCLFKIRLVSMLHSTSLIFGQRVWSWYAQRWKRSANSGCSAEVLTAVIAGSVRDTVVPTYAYIL